MRSCASGGLREPGLYPHFAAACRYLVGAVQLDAAALTLRRRCEDPAVLLAADAKPAVRAQSVDVCASTGVELSGHALSVVPRAEYARTWRGSAILPT